MLKYLSVTVFICCCVAQLTGQEVLQRRTHSPPPPYVLGPGDQIVLHVTDMEEISDKPLRIDPSGFIDLPLAGRIQAAGLTPDQLKNAVAQKLTEYITVPEVSVNVAESASQPVTVVGEVNSPGVHQLSGTKHLLEVISLSGGAKTDAGPNVIVTRNPQFGAIQAPQSRIDADGYSTATFSLDALMSSTHPEDNILIQPDDVISIPKAELVYVLGDVKKAGGFQLSTHPTIPLTQVLALAEGLAQDNAASRARILRQLPGGDGTPREIPVDIPKIMAGKAPDVQLSANDVLYVPHSGGKVLTRRAIEAAVGVTTGILIYR